MDISMDIHIHGNPGQTASPCHIWSNRSNRGLVVFRHNKSKMAEGRHLGFVMCVFGPPRRAFCDLYCSAKFGWNRCSSFDNTNCFSISRVWLENAYSRPQNCFLGGILPPKWGAISTKPKKAHPCASPHRLMRKNPLTRLTCR